MTPAIARRFRLGAYAVCWIVAAGLQYYAADVGTHGAIVGAYVPGWLLTVAAIPYWTLLGPAIVDAIAGLAAPRLTRGAVRALDWVNAIGLIAYAGASVGVLFYVAFANYGT